MTWMLTPPDVVHMQSAGIKLQGTPWGGTAQTLHLNVTRAPTDEVSVRRAIGYATDAESFAASQYIGTAAVGLLTAAVLDDPSLRSRQRHDPDKARELLDQAGWQLGPDGIRTRDGKRLDVVLNKRSDSNNGPYVLLQAQLREVGINASIKSQAQGAFSEDNAGCVDNGVIWTIRSGGMDALYQFYHSSNVGTGLNWSCLKNASIDQALEQGRRELDVSRRRQEYVQLEQTLMDLAVSVPLVDQLNMVAMRPEVRGLKFNGYSYPLLTDITFGA
jgi:peptide/nickel transport system substrate-binding protein